MSTNPNTIKSQDDLNTCNDGKRSSDVLLSTIEELERTKKQLEIKHEQLEIALWAIRALRNGNKNIFNKETAEPMTIEDYALWKIEELNK